LQVNFNISCLRRFVPELHNRSAEVRPSLAIPETGMKNADPDAVQRNKLMSQQPLMSPDGLKQLLGRRVAAITHRRDHAALLAPLRVKAVSPGEHLAIAFADRVLQCQATKGDWSRTNELEGNY
jgi:hypothetical protein